VVLLWLVTRFSLGRGFSSVLIPALHGRPLPASLRPLSLRLHDVSALPMICIPEPLVCSCTGTASHSTAPGCSLPFTPYQRYRCRIHWCHRCGTFAAQAGQKMADHPLGFAHLTSRQRTFSQRTADTAWHGFFLWVFLQGPSRRPLGRAWYYRTWFSLSLTQLLRPEQ
jgi:hypothetical protein